MSTMVDVDDGGLILRKPLQKPFDNGGSRPVLSCGFDDELIESRRMAVERARGSPAVPCTRARVREAGSIGSEHGRPGGCVGRKEALFRVLIRGWKGGRPGVLLRVRESVLFCVLHN
jgi:hypothetical protein